MHPTKRLSTRALIAAIVSVAILAAGAGALAWAAEQPSSEEASRRSIRAGEAEAAIVRTNLTGRMKAALGGAFGGVWFEQSTAQLHVGVTSPDSRRISEAVAAQADLTEIVTETTVGSTWAELQAAQDRWDERLMDLLERGEAATSLVAKRNAVGVELGSLVSPLRRNLLEHQAQAENVNVSVEIAPYPHLRVEPQSRCKEHAKGEAYCDPTLVAGMTFASEPIEEQRVFCTVGPTVIKKNNPTKTYVLTAGHCIDDGKEIGGKWYAYNKEGKSGIKEVGPAVAFLRGGGGVDVGVVEVTTGYWALAETSVPVVPMIAPWDQEEPEPFYVKEEREPSEGMRSCMSGQKTGTTGEPNCGEIIAIGETANVGGVLIENLVEVKAKSAGGDSGAPWYAEEPFNEDPPTGYVEGTHVGQDEETETQLFQPLNISFAKLKEHENIDLELLTTANESRVHTLTAPEGTPIPEATTVEAASEGSTTLDGSLTITCEKSTVKGKVTSKGGNSGPIESLTFSECGTRTVTVLKGGTFTIDFATGPDGTLTSDEAETTVLAHLPFSITTHCIYFTEDTDIGRVTGSASTGTATLHIDSAPIQRRSTDFGCGSTSEWTGSYKFTSPDYLDVD
jgi:hypothetical protein